MPVDPDMSSAAGMLCNRKCLLSQRTAARAKASLEPRLVQVLFDR